MVSTADVDSPYEGAGSGRKVGRPVGAKGKGPKSSGGEPGPPVDGAAVRVDEW